MNLCDPGRQLMTSEPESRCYLPVDDATWDEAVSSHGVIAIIDS